jgi:hypothetical protein
VLVARLALLPKLQAMPVVLDGSDVQGRSHPLLPFAANVLFSATSSSRILS